MHPYFSEEPECVFWFVHLRILRLGLIGSEQFSSTYFMLFQPVSPMHNCMTLHACKRMVIDFNYKLYICTKNPPLDRKLSAKSSCKAIFIKHKLPLEQFYNVWSKCLIFQLKPTFEIGSSLSFWHNRLSGANICSPVLSSGCLVEMEVKSSVDGMDGRSNRNFTFEGFGTPLSLPRYWFCRREQTLL